jgi:hypothetical protein
MSGGSEQAITHIRECCRDPNKHTCSRTGHIWQPFKKTSQGRSRSHLSLVHIFHTIPHIGLFVGGLYTIPVNISKGMVGYRPTTKIIKLCRFTGNHKMSMRSVQFKYLLKVPLWMVLNQQRWGLQPWSLEYPQTTPRPFHPKILHFPLVVPSGLKITSSSKPLSISILIPLVKKGGCYMRVGPTTRLLPIARTKHRTSNGNIYTTKVTRII